MTEVQRRSQPNVVRSKKPQSRCHACGVPRVESVCCRCYRLLCDKHDGVANPTYVRSSLRWARSRLHHRAGSAANGDKLLQRHFCRDCMPVKRLYDDELAAASITLGLGLLTGFSNLAVGGVLTTVGGLRIILRLFVARRQRRGDHHELPELRLDPQIRKLKVVETLQASARLDSPDNYTATVRKIYGEIEVEAVWARTDWHKVLHYRSRYHISKDENVTFSAGSLAVRGPANLVLRPTDPDSVKNLTMVELRSSTAEHVWLRPPGAHGDPRWTFKVDYEIIPKARERSTAVWLTPTIVPESGRRALELEVQWRCAGVLEIKEIVLICVSVPVSWGEVEDIAEPDTVAISTPNDGLREIEWKKPTNWTKSQVSKSWGSCRLSILFENQINIGTQTGAADHVTGQLKVRFSGAISGAENVRLYSSGGTRLMDGKPRPTSLVELDFDLSLSATSYQDVRDVPDPDRSDEIARTEELFKDVVPDYATVAVLTNHLSDGGYYVKRVLENPPQPGTKTGVLNRFWDIAGRYYDGVYPIDFHLVLTGEEVHARPIPAGTTMVRLTVRGSYATDEMENKVIEEWERLWDQIKKAMKDARSRPRGESDLPGLPYNEFS